MTNGADPAKVVGLGYNDGRTATAWYKLDYWIQLLPVAVAQWSECCAASPKDPGSIPGCEFALSARGMQYPLLIIVSKALAWKGKD